MAIQFCCTQCGQPIEVDSEHAGQTAACPYCRHIVAVPRESTYQPRAAVTARPVAPRDTGTASLETGPGVPEPHRIPVPPVRRRVANTFAMYGLICTALFVILFGAALVIGVSTFLRQAGGKPPASLTQEQMQRWQDEVMRSPGFVAAQVGALFFALVGLALGIVSLTQAARGNWRGITSVVVCGLFLLCVCSSTVFRLATGLGMPAGG